MGAPFFLIKEVIQQHGIHYRSSNYELYGDMSLRVVETLRTFSPHVEVYSVDESFLDLGDFKFLDLEAYARNIKDKVYQNLGLPGCIGVAPTKTLAKIANRLAKKSKKAQGCVVLTDPYHLEQALKRTAVEDVWGVGRQYAKFLNNYGIHTAFQLKNAPDAWIKKHCSVVMLRTVKELRGEPCADLELVPAAKQNICTSRGFGKPVEDFQTLLEATTSYAAKCAFKLRKQKSCAQEILVFLQTSKYSRNPRYNNFQKIVLPTASNSDLELIRHTKIALKNIYLPGYKYKKTGVIVQNIIPDTNRQLNLLDTTDHAKEQTLMQFIDGLTAKFGRDTVKVACQGTQGKKEWNLNREFLSSCYTTRLSDILQINI
jgi:DNA polymerase V